MKEVTLHDKTFALSIPESRIIASIDAMVEKMVNNLGGRKPLFLVVLNGAFMFASDLMKRVEVEAEVEFVRVSSYEGTASLGSTKEILGLTTDVKNRVVVVVEDIVDSGLTMKDVVKQMYDSGAQEVHIATMFCKPESIKYELPLTYVAMELPNDFIVGYGLDYDGLGRNLRDVYSLVQK